MRDIPWIEKLSKDPDVTFRGKVVTFSSNFGGRRNIPARTRRNIPVEKHNKPDVTFRWLNKISQEKQGRRETEKLRRH